MQCPIREHDHALLLHDTLTQGGTGKQAYIFECPKGAYRWFQTKERHDAGEAVSKYCRMDKPRWGWRD